MQLTISQSTLARELALLAPAAERKTTIPILPNVRIVADADGVTLTTTDLEHALVSRVTCAVKEPGSICLPAKRLYSLVAMLSGDVTIATDDKQYATVRAGRSRSRIAGMDVESFPEPPVAPDAAFSMDARVLARTFSRVAFAISAEESRFTLNGALMEVNGSLVRTVATDGHRLAFMEQGGATSSTLTLKTLVPKAAIGHFAKLADMSEGGARVAVSTDDNHLFFAIGSRLLVARKLVGSFPDYQRVLPKHDAFVTVDREEFVAAIKRVAQFADERSRAARFTFGGGEVRIAASSVECGESEESVPCEGALTIEAGFNAGYILDGLAAANHPKVAVFLRDEKSAGELRPMQGAGTEQDPYRVAEGYRCVVMPMRI